VVDRHLEPMLVAVDEVHVTVGALRLPCNAHELESVPLPAIGSLHVAQ
jgi:hypothetical protein